MKRLVALIVVLFSIKGSNGQTTSQLVGTWTLLYSLQPNHDSCNLPKEKATLILYSNGTYSWEINGGMVKGKWKTVANKISLYNNKTVNFEGNVADLLYPIDFKKETLIIREPEGGDIACPILYYKKKK